MHVLKQTVRCRIVALAIAGLVIGLACGAPARGDVMLYEGTWENTTFGSSGDAFFEIEIVGSTMTVTADMAGFVFGIGDPDPLVISGTVNPDGSASLEATDHPTYGDVSATIDSAGNIAAELTDVPDAFITGATATGQSFDGSTFHADYTVTFAQGDPAVGTVDADLVPEPVTVGLFSLGLGGMLVRRRWRR